MSNSTRPSSSSSSYDERFVVPLEASRRGAHRARVSPIMAALPVAAVVGIVVGAIVLVYWFLGGGRSEVGTGPTTVASPSAAATSSPTASDAAASPSEDPSTSSAVGGTVDKSITLDVYNGTTPNVSGLARRAANKLTAAGWTTGKIETWADDPVTQTTVYYGSAEQKATAQAVVKAIGRGTVKLSESKAGAGMAVVIGNDFPGVGLKTSPTSRSTGRNRSATTPSGTPSGAESKTSPQASLPDTGPGDDASPSPSPGDN